MFQVILMFRLGLPERTRRRHLGDYLTRPKPGRIHVGDGVVRDAMLFFARVKYGRSITRSPVVALPVQRGRIVNLEEELKQLAIADLAWIEDNLDGFRVRSVVAIGGVRNITARVTRPAWRSPPDIGAANPACPKSTRRRGLRFR